MSPTRIVIFLALSVTLILSACSSSRTDSSGGKNLQTVTVVGLSGSLYVGQAFTADAGGILEKHGLKLKFITVNTSGAAITGALTSGETDFILAGPATIAKVDEKGQHIGYACGVRGTSDYTILVGPKSTIPISANGSNGFTTLRALKGKRIGVAGIGSSNQLAAIAALQSAGVDQTDVTWVSLGGIGAQVASLTTGRVDALMGTGGTNEPAEAAGAKVALNINQVPTLKNVYETGWVVNEPYADKHAEKIDAFCAAMAETAKFMATSKGNDLSVRQLEQKDKVSEPIAKLFLAHTVPYLDADLSTREMSYTVDFLKQSKQASSSFNQSLVWQGSKYVTP